ncbi:MAG: hypothetical protein WBQ26_08575 [Gemmatimonadaceae bacterium]|nr:hypothetical protein [Gemmatimonadaceae bacterium]
MTVGAWLSRRTLRPPEALDARVRRALGGRLALDASETHRVCEAAAEEVLSSLLGARETGRESALDLLAVDALVTYAFEHAAAGGDLDAMAVGAMQRIAAIGAHHAAAGDGA